MYFGESNSGIAGLFSSTGMNAEPKNVAPEQLKWLYRDPSVNTFESLGRKTRDDERSFSVSITCTIVLDNDQQRFHRTTSVHNIPFDRYQFGKVFERNDISTPNSPPLLASMFYHLKVIWIINATTKLYRDIWHVSAPFTNAPNPPFVGALKRSACWQATSAEQPTSLMIQFLACYTIGYFENTAEVDKEKDDSSPEETFNKVDEKIEELYRLKPSYEKFRLKRTTEDKSKETKNWHPLPTEFYFKKLSILLI
ncbi:4232_t:CDS:2 [Funneliformis geosporum]|uniref:4232_t:CDS:1 n=1 Tax=Funneliformis geosporum TaxID=1117311 RepID=A0A9W4T220_9GLOM|nr:4232_t:CDS:2 [Funneliformis geosporum]